MAGAFVREYPIRFEHCDPAGIVFFPRYHVLFNALTEDWFNEGLKLGYRDFICGRRIGLPIIKQTTEFFRPSSFGEVLSFELGVTHMGNTSFTLGISVHGSDGIRIHSEHVLCTTSLDSNAPIRLPADFRERAGDFRIAPKQNADARTA
jgi:4-hydroxybenzoyl-CoA thioesterase